MAGSAFGAGIAGVVLLAAATAAFDGLSFNAARMHDGAVVRAFVDAGNAMFALAGLAFAALLLAGSAAGPLPRWLRSLGYVGAATLVVSGLSLVVDHGPLQAGNVLGLVFTLPAIVWIGAASVVTLRATRAATSSG